jgi:hypothetical protein
MMRLLSLIAVVGAALVAACASPTGKDVAPASVPQPFAGPHAVDAGARGADEGTKSAAGHVGASSPSAAPGAPPPFARVIEGAKRIDGPLVMWQKEDKVWIQLTPAQFGEPFLMSPKIRTGIGQGWVLGGLMAFSVGGAGGPQVVEFVRVYNQVRLQAMNLEVTAAAGTPEARAVASSYSPSLLGSTQVASQPDPKSKAVLVEANGLFLSDMLGIGMMLQRSFHQGYGMDSRHSSISAVRGSAAASVIETQNHFYTGNLALAQPGTAPGVHPQVPRYVPDARSLFVGLHYSLSPLPAVPMATRAADPRVGYFSTSVLDFSNDLARSPRERFVDRWRLEKKDPAAALSEPVKPIAFWIDRNVPLAYRDTIRSAILEWNKAFERIGFKNAITVQQQPDDASFDTLDTGHVSVRWMMDMNPMFGAIGPSNVDPRTGEILDADIGIEGMMLRSSRNERTQLLNGVIAGGSSNSSLAADFAAAFPNPYRPPVGLRSDDYCAYAGAAAEQMSYALDVLAARDELDPKSPEAQRFVLDYLKDSVMHEVGHVLGLRHNFRASRVYTQAQLSDPAFTRANGTSGSVMEYRAVNLARPGERAGTPFQLTLGPYDYWAIEYAYKPIAKGQEKAVLQEIAARSNEPLLAYGTDEDNNYGLDPETVQLDLGNDPVAFASKRLDIARDLFKRQETRHLSPDEDYAVLRRSLNFALADVTRSVALLARQIGGVRTLRDYPGSGREPLQPVSAQVQRQSLDLIVSAVLGADGLTLTPALQRRLAPDYLDRGEFGTATDYALPQRLLNLQRTVLGYLMSEAVAARILDSAAKVDRPQDAFTLSDLYAPITTAIWSGLESGASVPAARRDLQRDHVNRLAQALLHPLPRADARALMRVQAKTLLARLEASNRRPGRRDAETRAHLQDSAETLRQALSARLPRLGV